MLLRVPYGFIFLLAEEHPFKFPLVNVSGWCNLSYLYLKVLIISNPFLKYKKYKILYICTSSLSTTKIILCLLAAIGSAVGKSGSNQLCSFKGDVSSVSGCFTYLLSFPLVFFSYVMMCLDRAFVWFLSSYGFRFIGIPAFKDGCLQTSRKLSVIMKLNISSFLFSSLSIFKVYWYVMNMPQSSFV